MVKVTEKFCSNGLVFDCLSVHCMDAWKDKKKNNLKPYTDPNDERLKVAMRPNINYCHIICMHAHVGSGLNRMVGNTGGTGETA